MSTPPLDAPARLPATEFAARMAAMAERGRVEEYVRKGRTYYRIRIRVEGELVEIHSHKGQPGESAPFTSERHAEAVLDQIRGRLGKKDSLEAIADFLPSLSKPLRVVELLREYLEDMEERQRLGEISLHTLTNLRRRVPTDPPRPPQYFAFWERHSVAEIRRYDLEKFKRHLEAVPLAPPSVRLLMDQFRAFLRWCVDIRELPITVPAFPTVRVQQGRPKLHTPAQQRAVLDEIPWRKRGIFLFMALGVRPGAARVRKMEDIHEGFIHVHSAAQHPNSDAVPAARTKGRKGYWVPITRELGDWIDQFCANRLPGAWLFYNPDSPLEGQRWPHGTLVNVWRTTCEYIGVPYVGLYKGTKHSFATGRALAGKSKDQIAEFLSISPRQAETYIQWARELSAEVLDEKELSAATRATVRQLKGQGSTGEQVGNRRNGPRKASETKGFSSGNG